MSTPKKINAIPEPPKAADPALRSFLAALKEAVEVRLGRRGDPLEEAVTKRELLDAGIARLGSAYRNDLLPVTVEPEGVRIVPPVPIGFVAEGVFGGIHLTWENPFQAYNVHAYTEVWRGETNDPTKRILINSSRGATFFDRIPDEDAGEYWYWVRFVSEYNREGPFSQPFKARKEADIGELMTKLSGQIDKSSLSQAFLAEYTGVAETVAQHSQTLTQQGTSITQQALLIKQQGETNDAQGKAITGLSAQFTLRLNVNGYVSGFGAYNDGKVSDFAVVADNFWIAAPNSTGKVKPFIVENGVVYIDTARIRDASIQQGKLGPISFGKIIDSAGNPVTTLAGKLRADAIDVESLQVTDANIAGVLKSNAKAANGQPRWMLDKNGGMTLNGSSAAGRMEIRETVIKVFDGVGRRRVQLGDLTL
jgi:hypothetical protein